MTFFGVVWTYIMTLGLGQIVILTLGLKVYTLMVVDYSTDYENKCYVDTLEGLSKFLDA